ncbi:MAG: DEAD/DEAH box helicase, partial [Pseudomonadota bacterium]|nr:DEAD/DEAH box helicase [Pseudomonadota bacterium]
MGEITLPTVFANWFATRGWHPRAHQQALWAETRAGNHALLIAPTGGGKTLAGFLPSLIDLADGPESRTQGLHTVYVSPLKALAVDIQRNLMVPVEEMGLDIRIEIRTGDTPPNRKQRQKTHPPQIMLTTPEQIALMLSWPEAPSYFAGLRHVIIDELHALYPNKRGDLLALGLARLNTLAPNLVCTGLSATVAEPDSLRRYLAPQTEPDSLASLVVGAEGAAAQVDILDTKERLPWGSHSALHAMSDVLAAVEKVKT